MNMRENDRVRIELGDDGVAQVRLVRADKMNALDGEMFARMIEAGQSLHDMKGLRAVVLSGEGPAWTAGMDLKEYFRETESQGLAGTRKAQRESYGWWRRLRWYQKPTIAMVNGGCFGGGYGPLFSCDLAFAAEEAKFGLSEINWGILPGGGATKVAQELLPFRKAMYHAMMGENIDGRTAAEWGLVNEALPLAAVCALLGSVISSEGMGVAAAPMGDNSAHGLSRALTRTSGSTGHSGCLRRVCAS